MIAALRHQLKTGWGKSAMTLTSDSPASITASRALSLALGQGGGGGGEASSSGINVSYTGTGVGETLTITTSSLDFTSKPNAKPFWYVDTEVEGSLDASPLSRNAISLSGTGIGNIDNSTFATPAANFSAVGTSPDYKIVEGIGPTLGAIKTDTDGAGDHIRVFTKFRRDFDGSDAYAKWQALNPTSNDWNIKRWRWWSETGSPKNNMVFSFGQLDREDGNPRITPENSVTGTEYQDGTDKALYGMKKDQWISEIVEIKQSSAAGVGDGFVRQICDGQEHLFSSIVTRDDDGNDGSYVDFVIEQWQFVYTDVTFNLWHRFFYLDDTPHAVVLTDKPNWGDEGAEIDPVIPTAWSGDEITATLRCSAAGKYLYVIDGSGSVLNQAGVEL